MTRCLTLALSLILSFALAPVALAQADRDRDRDRSQAGQGGSISAQDLVKEMTPPADSNQFAMKAAEDNLFEIRLADLAQQKSQSQEVKQLAQQIKQDHEQAQQQLQQAAQGKQANLPNDLQGPKQVMLQAFQQLDGKVFDNAFTLHQVKDHLHAMMMYKNEAQNGTDPQIKQYAQQCLPKLRQHSQHIAQVAQSMQIPVEALAAGGAGESARPAGGTIRGSGQEQQDRNQNRPQTGGQSQPRTGQGGQSDQDRDK